MFEFAGSRRAIDFAQSRLSFLFPLFHLECVEVIVACARAEDVWIFFGPAFGEAQVLVECPASDGKATAGLPNVGLAMDSMPLGLSDMQNPWADFHKRKRSKRRTDRSR